MEEKTRCMLVARSFHMKRFNNLVHGILVDYEFITHFQVRFNFVDLLKLMDTFKVKFVLRIAVNFDL